MQWAAAKNHLKALEAKGCIRVNQYKSRGIEIIGLKHTEGFMAPVVGNIRAGCPVLAVEDITSHILPDKTLFPSERAFYLKSFWQQHDRGRYTRRLFDCRKPQSDIYNGEIGVVLIEDEATVKRVYMSKGKVTLNPENRAMELISYSAEDISILWKVIGVIRKM